MEQDTENSQGNQEPHIEHTETQTLETRSGSFSSASEPQEETKEETSSTNQQKSPTTDQARNVLLQLVQAAPDPLYLLRVLVPALVDSELPSQTQQAFKDAEEILASTASNNIVGASTTLSTQIEVPPSTTTSESGGESSEDELGRKSMRL